MAERWTIKQLDEMDNISFAIQILRERKAKCTNYYSPLSEKLSKAIGQLEMIKYNNMCNSAMEREEC